MTTTSNQKPIARLQDGLLKTAIWKNKSKKGHFYSVSPVKRTYKQNGNYKETTSLSGTQILQAQRLLGRAYNHIRDLEAVEYAARKEAEKPSS